MAARSSRREDGNGARDDWDDEATPRGDGIGRERRNGGRSVAGEQQDQVSLRRRAITGAVFDPGQAIRVGLLRLARNWQESGSTYQAIHVYTEVLIRYPQTGAANAAVEELLVMADDLARQGRHYAALNIFNKLEQLY